MRRYPLIICFFMLLALLTCLDISNEDKKFSELENRNLKSNVSFSIKKFYEGSFQEDYEEYIGDQFILRDRWINLKSICENILGKQENNNIVYGENEYLFDKFISLDESRLDVNINAINHFIKATDINVSTMIVPNSYEIYKEYVKWPIPLVNQEEKLIEIGKRINESNYINLIESMREAKDSYLYYKTDHHWTSYGAYIAYKKYIRSIDDNPINLEEYEKESVSNFFGTYYSKAKPFSNLGDELTYYNIEGITLEIGTDIYDGLYDYSKLNTRDKYEVFLYGNNPLTIVKNTSIKNGKKLLVIKDSYANSMIPFLTQNFAEIHIVDLRAFSSSIQRYSEGDNFDEILIIYNFINFTKESSVVKLKV